jgi:hypothetical protein
MGKVALNQSSLHATLIKVAIGRLGHHQAKRSCLLGMSINLIFFKSNLNMFLINKVSIRLVAIIVS